PLERRVGLKILDRLLPQQRRRNLNITPAQLEVVEHEQRRNGDSRGNPGEERGGEGHATTLSSAPAACRLPIAQCRLPNARITSASPFASDNPAPIDPPGSPKRLQDARCRAGRRSRAAGRCTLSGSPCTSSAAARRLSPRPGR